jgi:amidase
MAIISVDRDVVGYQYAAAIPARATVLPGATIRVATHDARAGLLDDRTPGTMFELPRPPAQGNPLTGPIAIEGAAPGDTLVVRIDAIDLDAAGWAGGHAHVNPLEPGRIPRPIGRRIAVAGGIARFSERFELALRPMVGCIGVATAPSAGDPPSSGFVGRFGGNMDQPVVGPGSTVFLPVLVKDALLYIGDIHATQGDGELSGVALEIGSRVTVTVDLLPGRTVRWPWVAFGDRLAVMTSDEDFVVARREAVDAVIAALESAYAMEPGEALALVSLAGDMRMGQTMGRGPMTLRLEVPRWDGLEPV